jgi:hypothetical protein
MKQELNEQPHNQHQASTNDNQLLRDRIFAVGAIASIGAWLERLTTFRPQAAGSSKGNFWKLLGVLLDPRLPGNEKADF